MSNEVRTMSLTEFKRAVGVAKGLSLCRVSSEDLDTIYEKWPVADENERVDIVQVLITALVDADPQPALDLFHRRDLEPSIGLLFKWPKLVSVINTERSWLGGEEIWAFTALEDGSDRKWDAYANRYPNRKKSAVKSRLRNFKKGNISKWYEKAVSVSADIGSPECADVGLRPYSRLVPASIALLEMEFFAAATTLDFTKSLEHFSSLTGNINLIDELAACDAKLWVADLMLDAYSAAPEEGEKLAEKLPEVRTGYYRFPLYTIRQYVAMLLIAESGNSASLMPEFNKLFPEVPYRGARTADALSDRLAMLKGDWGKVPTNAKFCWGVAPYNFVSRELGTLTTIPEFKALVAARENEDLWIDEKIVPVPVKGMPTEGKSFASLKGAVVEATIPDQDKLARLAELEKEMAQLRKDIG